MSRDVFVPKRPELMGGRPLSDVFIFEHCFTLSTDHCTQVFLG